MDTRIDYLKEMRETRENGKKRGLKPVEWSQIVTKSKNFGPSSPQTRSFFSHLSTGYITQLPLDNMSKDAANSKSTF